MTLGKRKKGQVLKGYIQDITVDIKILNMQNNTVYDLEAIHTRGRSVWSMRMVNATFKTAVTSGKKVGRDREVVPKELLFLFYLYFLGLRHECSFY